MNPLLFIARRHLKSPHSFSFISFISYLSIVGLAIGVSVLILTLAVLNGFETEVQRKIISFDGHIRLRGFLGNPLPETDSHADSIINDIPQIVNRAPYIHSAAMIRYKNKTEGVLVEGITEQNARNVFGTPKMMRSGVFEYGVNSTGLEGIVIGEDLAQDLGINVGDKVALIDIGSMALPGKPMRIKQFAVSGIFSTGLKEYDNSVVYIDFHSSQVLFDLDKKKTGEIISVSIMEFADNVSQQLDEQLGYPYIAATWKDRHYNLFAWLNLQKYPITIIFALIALIAIVNITSSLTMVVMEKSREIGILRSLGFSRKDISRIFVIEGGIIGSIGVITGFILTLFLGFIQTEWGILKISEDVYFMRSLPVLFSLNQFVIVGLTGFILALFATYYPAWKASNIHPAQALRYE